MAADPTLTAGPSGSSPVPTPAAVRHPGVRPAPRRRLSLTTRLVAVILVIMAAVLGAFGAATVAVMHRNLAQRLDSDVQQAALRSLTYARTNDRDDEHDRNPIDAPGQPTRVLTLVRDPSGAIAAFYRVPDGSATALRVADVQTIADAGLLTAGAGTLRQSDAENDSHQAGLQTVRLSIGEYRMLPITVVDPSTGAAQVVVTGLPTSTVDGPVALLTVTELIGGASALALAGLVAALAITRSLRPLARISTVATEVAAMPLETGPVDLSGRRVPADLAEPGTEVGNVGHALNLLIDNVDEALAARSRTERQLRAFVADASHELRTPLAAVRGYTDILRLTEDLSPEGRTSLGRVESQADRMTALVEDLLMLARLDEGRTPTFVDLDLSELAVEAVLDATAAGPDHTFTCDVPDDAMTVHGDGRQLSQVLANLLSNARKHTPAGSTVRTVVRRGGDGFVEATVTDDGRGIAADFLPHLFDRFARGDSSRKSTEGSTGLGLAIVRAVVEAHGGTVGCTSRPGETVFTVRLPPAGSLAVRP
ncbi:HAMP domain-containing sensor histidine kinase [Raineyella sp. LH-20]|uniref:sensor histidine kinase n=1 Tax=Raineyella sp. LH-20 TaxID=3081204 RepID=UPI0029549B0D|nr:HAMP domain-containing sensor histidine kinase [Raineyella sp. LH-20]WOP20028.1 HAMP domain-containing sensor histidine kinase [Raineyella sp. LH-20]